ncbi:hypothetical protein EYR36_005591 [Pleurotus pulmonarius]|nr:hypothetical protein EYR36_005591 [Pleurotus pulmonarius]
MVFEYVVDMEIPLSFVPRLVSTPRFAPSSVEHIYEQPPAVYVVSAVCRRWRDVAKAFPQLWSSIRQVSYRENQWLDLNLERSKTVPLKIFVQYEMLARNKKPTTVELLGRLIPYHAERIQELHMSSISPEVVSLLNTPLPNLTCLTLKHFPNFPPGSTRTIFASQTPRLKQLTLHACPFFPDHTFKGLTHLCIASEHTSTSAWPLDHFLDVLRASPDLEELYIAQTTFRIASDVRLERSKVYLSRLRILSIGRYQDSLSALFDILVVPHPIEFLAWGTGVFHKLLDFISTLYPAPLGDAKLTDLRISSINPHHPSLIFPKHGYTIVSNGEGLQVDGRLEPHNFLLAAPGHLDISNVTQLWLGVSFNWEPSLEEWRGFFWTVPLVVTLVISHRSSFQILFALTLTAKEENQIHQTLPITGLDTLRIFADRNISVPILSQFVQQRARMGKRLKVCEIIADGKESDLGWEKCRAASAGPASPPMTADNEARLKEFIDEVDCSKVVADPWWEVIKTPALGWVDRLWPAE